MLNKLLIFTAFSAGAAMADSVSLRPIADSTMYFSATSELSNSQGEFLFAGKSGFGDPRRALIKFDISGSLPPDAQISSAQLLLTITRQAGSATSVDVYRCLTDWTQGTSDAPDSEGGGAPATPGDPTWTYASFATRAWNLPGGDFNNVPRASSPVTGATSVTFSGPGLTADVASWFNLPDQNFGWLLQGDESSASTATRFASRENPAQADRPTLIITYTRACPADFNADASVDFFDYLDFVAAFASSDPIADFNSDSAIDFFDYLDFVAAFAQGC